MRTVGPGHLVFWGDSGRALSDASHTWRTAKSLQQMSSEWHGQSQRGTQAFYLSLTPFNPVEDDFGHRQQICWTWAQQGSKTFSTSQSQAGNVIGFIFRSLYEGVSVVEGTWWWCETAKRPIWGSETLISLYLLKWWKEPWAWNKKTWTPVLNRQATLESQVVLGGPIFSRPNWQFSMDGF